MAYTVFENLFQPFVSVTLKQGMFQPLFPPLVSVFRFSLVPIFSAGGVAKLRLAASVSCFSFIVF